MPAQASRYRRKELIHKNRAKEIRQLAAIEYHGRSGITQPCVEAIARLIHFGHTINEAKLLSHKDAHGGLHGFLLKIDDVDIVAIKAGFSSGYSGEGPRGLSTALHLLYEFGSEIHEYIVTREFIERMDASCLSHDDLLFLEKSDWIRPQRWVDYMYTETNLRRDFRPVIPFHILDPRLLDLAKELPLNPDAAITIAFRRLEDIVRERSGIYESGSRLFAKAFQAKDSVLWWEDLDESEKVGKANLFIGVFNAFRNPRSHREFQSSPGEALREFMLINELYLIEERATLRPDVSMES